VSAQVARLRYLADQVNTASAGGLIVLLYDRLGLDIEVAAAAQADGDLIAASGALSHAQRVVTELFTSLDTSTWSGGDNLAALYQYLLLNLINARTAPDQARLRGLGEIVSSLRAAWQQAVAESNSGQRSGESGALTRVG
jgi:flagellar secretion chaperone FliS